LEVRGHEQAIQAGLLGGNAIDEDAGLGIGQDHADVGGRGSVRAGLDIWIEVVGDAAARLVAFTLVGVDRAAGHARLAGDGGPGGGPGHAGLVVADDAATRVTAFQPRFTPAR